MALSDQHGFKPRVPECDLLIVAGDNCPDFPHGARERIGSGPQVDLQEKWFYSDWLPWRNKQPVADCVATWGNHDYVGERLHASEPKRLIDDRTTIVADGLFEIGSLGIWLTPWSSQFCDWAWMSNDDELAARYDPIPIGVDILVSHQPPRGHCDEVGYAMDGSRGVEHVGSRTLLAAIARVKPRIVICGHIHGGMRCSTFNDTRIYNVSLLNELYKMVRKPMEIYL